MKSAYELAMERLDKEDPQGIVSLTDEQKTALQDIQERYRAKIAEREVFLGGKLEEARMKMDHEAIDQLETQLRNEKKRLEEECEKAKDKVRNAGKGE